MAREKFITDYRQDMRIIRTRPQRVWAVIITALLIGLPFLLGNGWIPPFNFPWVAWMTVINLSLTAIIGAAAFNLLVGNTGQVSLAHAGLLIFGTIISGLFGPLWGWNFWIVLPLTLVAGALGGVIIALPALRLKGLYLLLATLGIYYFAYFVYKWFLVQNFGFIPIIYGFPSIPEWFPWLNEGDTGLQISNNFRWYWVMLPITALSLLFMSNVIRTSEGRAFNAVKARDTASSLVGVSPVRSKLIVFMVSSAFVTMSGALQSYFLTAREEASYPFQTTLDYAIMIVLGGFSSILGAVFGALFFYGAPVWIDWIRQETPVLRDITFLSSYKSEINLAVFGLLIVVVLVRSPDGLSGAWKRVKSYFAKWPYSL
jgi:branched-chain amino acid transport system permease protein